MSYELDGNAISFAIAGLYKQPRSQALGPAGRIASRTVMLYIRRGRCPAFGFVCSRSAGLAATGKLYSPTLHRRFEPRLVAINNITADRTPREAS